MWNYIYHNIYFTQHDEYITYTSVNINEICCEKYRYLDCLTKIFLCFIGCTLSVSCLQLTSNSVKKNFNDLFKNMYCFGKWYSNNQHNNILSFFKYICDICYLIQWNSYDPALYRLFYALLLFPSIKVCISIELWVSSTACIIIKYLHKNSKFMKMILV